MCRARLGHCTRSDILRVARAPCAAAEPGHAHARCERAIGRSRTPAAGFQELRERLRHRVNPDKILAPCAGFIRMHYSQDVAALTEQQTARTPGAEERDVAEATPTLGRTHSQITPGQQRTPEEVTAIMERSRELLGRISPVRERGTTHAVQSTESFSDAASAALSELSGEVLGLSAVIVRQQEEAGELKNRQERTEDALRIAEERMQVLEKQCAGISETLNLQALEHVRKLSSPSAALSVATPPLPSVRTHDTRLGQTGPRASDLVGASARGARRQKLHQRESGSESESDSGPEPEPQPEPELEPESEPELQMEPEPQNISPVQPATTHSPESDVWVTPAGVVEVTDDGSDTTTGEYRFGEPFENVPPGSREVQAELNDMEAAGSDHFDDPHLREADHERRIWEHFLLLRHNARTRVLHGLFGVAHSPNYPKDRHGLCQRSSILQHQGRRREGEDAGTGTSSYERRHGAGQGSSVESPSHAAVLFRPLSPGQVGFANALSAGLVSSATSATEIAERGDDSSANAPRTPSTGGVWPSRATSNHSQPQPQQDADDMSIVHSATASTPALVSQTDAAAHDSVLIGRALVAGNCLLDAC